MSKSATKTAPVAAAAPVAEKVKKVKAKRIAHPIIGAKTGYPFDAIPTDYDVKLHKPLKKKDFAATNDGQANFLIYTADRLQPRLEAQLKRVGEMRVEAENVRKFGSQSKAKQLKKLTKLREAIAALEAELAG